MCVEAPITKDWHDQSIGTGWTDIGQVAPAPGHRTLTACVRVSDAASVRLLGPHGAELWAPAATSGAASLTTTIDLGPPLVRLQVKAASGTVTVSGGLYVR